MLKGSWVGNCQPPEAELGAVGMGNIFKRLTQQLAHNFDQEKVGIILSYEAMNETKKDDAQATGARVLVAYNFFVYTCL